MRGFAGAEVLVYVGVVMTMFPIFYAVIENDLRRVLSYSMINQIGFMVTGVGIGTALALNGAVAHAFADAGCGCRRQRGSLLRVCANQTEDPFWLGGADPEKPMKRSQTAEEAPRPVATHGLTHVALAVRDPSRSLRFYRAVLGVVPVYESDDFVQAQTPGSRDVLVFERHPETAGHQGGIVHFGFRLQRPEDITVALAAIEAAGGDVREHGEFVPGEPYVFFTDPDGYDVEIWYELPTPVDPA